MPQSGVYVFSGNRYAISVEVSRVIGEKTACLRKLATVRRTERESKDFVCSCMHVY